MRKNDFYSIVYIVLFFLYPSLVSAVSKITVIIQNTQKVIQSFIAIVFSIAVLVFGWGIVKLITSADNQEEIKKAKWIILWSVIGLTVLASIAGLILFFQQYFGIEGQNTISIPQFK